ncbi:NAD-dependent epimerase/dehydratase family protein [Geobacter anodireducens]
MNPGEGIVLVTGATGFIGKRLVSALLAGGHRVRCLVRRPDAPLPHGAERVVGDILTREGSMPPWQGLTPPSTWFIPWQAAGPGLSGGTGRRRRIL